MILKKPYAFLIKHFRLIHLIITAILTYILYFNNGIYKYIKICIKDNVYKYEALSYINYNILIYIAIVIILYLVVFWLLKYKDKPRSIYIISIAGYMAVGIICMIVFNYFYEFPNKVIEQKTIRLYRDILTVMLSYQLITTLIMFIRGLGFDIKKFNFSKDFKELNIASEDNDEVEVNFGIDTTNIVRGVRKQKRELGYFYHEYNGYIIGIFLVLLIIVSYSSYKYLSKKFKIYHQNQQVGLIYNVAVTNSYFNISDDGNFIIVKFNVRRNGVQERLTTSNMELSIDDTVYIPDKNICYKFNDLGNCYKKQYVYKDYVEYILTYDVDKLVKDKTYLIYNDTNGESYKIKLDLQNY